MNWTSLREAFTTLLTKWQALQPSTRRCTLIASAAFLAGILLAHGCSGA